MIKLVNSEKAQVVLLHVDTDESEVLMRGTLFQCRENLKIMFNQAEGAVWAGENEFMVVTQQGDIISKLMVVTGEDRVPEFIDMA